jgi:hypothetical protein
MKKAIKGKKERDRKAGGKSLLKKEREKAKRLGPTIPPKLSFFSTTQSFSLSLWGNERTERKSGSDIKKLPS